MKKNEVWNRLDDFSRFFRHCNYVAFASSNDDAVIMLKSIGSTISTTITLTPSDVVIHHGDERRCFSCMRDEWGPDFIKKVSSKMYPYNDFKKIANNYKSYQTLNDFGRYLVDDCWMSITCSRPMNPKLCYLEKTVYDSENYYSTTIYLRNDNYFDLSFEIMPFKDKSSSVKKYNNWTNFNVDTIEEIGKQLPIKILSDYVKKYKKIQAK